MRSLLITTVTLIAMLASVPLSAGSHDVAADYAMATTPFLGITCAPDCTPAKLNIGGVAFPANGEVPLTVTVDDFTGGDVQFSVCQNLDGDQLCGNPGGAEGAEANLATCGRTADLTQSAVPFSAFAETRVFVYSASMSCPSGLGTTGTVTITYG